MKISKNLMLLSALALGTTLASAATAVDTLRVNVPFSFVLAGKVFPAGQYTVQESSSGVMTIMGEGKSAVALTVPASPAKAGSAPALHFTSTNSREYLVAIDSESVTRSVPQHAYETRTLTLSK